MLLCACAHGAKPEISLDTGSTALACWGRRVAQIILHF